MQWDALLIIICGAAGLKGKLSYLWKNACLILWCHKGFKKKSKTHFSKLCLCLDVEIGNWNCEIVAFLVWRAKWNDNRQLAACSESTRSPFCDMNLWCLKVFDPGATWSSTGICSWCNWTSVGWNVAPASSAYFITHFWFHQLASADISSRRTSTSSWKSKPVPLFLLFGVWLKGLKSLRWVGNEKHHFSPLKKQHQQP